MAEPVTVVWWTADAPLFESVVHPGRDEGFVALYPRKPAPEQRAICVAVVPRSDLPSRRGMATAAWDGRRATTVVRGEEVALDLSLTAPSRTRTPPWDLLPTNQWVDARRPGWLDRLSRRQRLAVTVALVPLCVGALYFKALNITDGHQGDAVKIAGFGVAVYVAIIMLSFLVARPDGDTDG